MGRCILWRPVRSLLILFLSLLPAFPVDAVAQDRAWLEALLAASLEDLELPGVRAAVRLSDGRIVRAATGFADVEARVALDDTIGMPGGSTGKTFVAALAMLLVQDGTLSLDDLASKWLGAEPWFARLPNADSIRVRHLLSHTAGIGDYPERMGYKLTSFWRALRTGSVHFEVDELIGYVLDREPAFPAGGGYRYTDAGYLVLGRLLEAATGRAYFDLLRARILEPHHLSQIRPADRPVIPDVAVGYARGARNLREDGRMKLDPRSEWTGGGLVTNPTMLVEFFAALAEGRIVTQPSLQQMLEAGWRGPEAELWRYGYGLFIYDGGESFGHAGMWPGYRTLVIHHVPTETTIAVQTNRDGPVELWIIVNDIVAMFGPGLEERARDA